MAYKCAGSWVLPAEPPARGAAPAVGSPGAENANRGNGGGASPMAVDAEAEPSKAQQAQPQQRDPSGHRAVAEQGGPSERRDAAVQRITFLYKVRRSGAGNTAAACCILTN